jgi:spore germination cell wall hydrolase CwlJ-like protein
MKKLITSLLILITCSVPGMAKANVPEMTRPEQTELVQGQFIVPTIDTIDIPTVEIIKPIIDDIQLQCLAQNIFYEAASEPEEGKIAVGLVTIYRTQDSRFPSTICGVVNQRTIIPSSHKSTIKNVSKNEHHTICQFSWKCRSVHRPKVDDPHWIESQRIANLLLVTPDTYTQFEEKYKNVLYFHAARISPAWAHQKVKVTRIGAQLFYR